MVAFLLQIRLVVVLVILLAGLSLQAQGQQQSSDEKNDDKRTAAITGSVVSDTGQPLASVAVVARSLNSLLTRNTTTANDGSFKISGLDPSLYMLSASMPAYVPRPRESDSFGYYKPGDHVKLELVKGGVITGAVTNILGEPVIAIRVRAYKIREADGAPSRVAISFGERTTDDRGIYRLYGLSPGTYLVAAGSTTAFITSNLNPYDSDVPTYAPSSTRDTAAEFVVHSGEETTNVDIRYRGEPGHSISGVANAQLAAGSPYSPPVNVTLSPVANSIPGPNIIALQQPGSRGFIFSGIPDGTYDLVAQSAPGINEFTVSDPLRVVVKGADVTGLELRTKPLGSISGRVVLETLKVAECKGKREPLFTETAITAQRKDDKSIENAARLRFGSGFSLPEKDGAFTIRNLGPGDYGLSTRFFAKYWYLRSITFTQPGGQRATRSTAVHQPLDAFRNWIALKQGEQLTGLSIKLALGAASFHGTVKMSDATPIPARLFVQLVPAEQASSEDAMRFFATRVEPDGSFALGNLAPGRYFALVSVAADDGPAWLSKLRTPDLAATRAKLWRAAAAAKTEIELSPCQNISDYQLLFKGAAPLR